MTGGQKVLERKFLLQRSMYVFPIIHEQIATEGVLSEDDPTRLKGNLDNIGSSSDEEEDEENTNSAKSATKEEDKTYKIPKVSQTPYGKMILYEALRDRLLCVQINWHLVQFF